MSKTVTITGAAGQIGYQLAFRIASGQLLGANQKINLNLLEITPALDALKGVAMELEDCAFDTLDKISVSDDPNGPARQGLHDRCGKPPRHYYCGGKISRLLRRLFQARQIFDHVAQFAFGNHCLQSRRHAAWAFLLRLDI